MLNKTMFLWLVGQLISDYNTTFYYTSMLLYSRKYVTFSSLPSYRKGLTDVMSFVLEVTNYKLTRPKFETQLQKREKKNPSSTTKVLLHENEKPK